MDAFIHATSNIRTSATVGVVLRLTRRHCSHESVWRRPTGCVCRSEASRNNRPGKSTTAAHGVNQAKSAQILSHVHVEQDGGIVFEYESIPPGEVPPAVSSDVLEFLARGEGTAAASAADDEVLSQIIGLPLPLASVSPPSTSSTPRQEHAISYPAAAAAVADSLPVKTVEPPEHAEPELQPADMGAAAGGVTEAAASEGAAVDDKEEETVGGSEVKDEEDELAKPEVNAIEDAADEGHVQEVVEEEELQQAEGVAEDEITATLRETWAEVQPNEEGDKREEEGEKLGVHIDGMQSQDELEGTQGDEERKKIANDILGLDEEGEEELVSDVDVPLLDVEGEQEREGKLVAGLAMEGADILTAEAEEVEDVLPGSVWGNAAAPPPPAPAAAAAAVAGVAPSIAQPAGNMWQPTEASAGQLQRWVVTPMSVLGWLLLLTLTLSAHTRYRQSVLAKIFAALPGAGLLLAAQILSRLQTLMERQRQSSGRGEELKLQQARDAAAWWSVAVVTISLLIGRAGMWLVSKAYA